jgi:hypothetical protein
MSLQNGSHLPTTQCACADFVDFATQRNGGSGREKDLLVIHYFPIINFSTKLKLRVSVILE